MKKIEIYQTFEEQEQAQLRHLASLSSEESMALFAALLRRATLFGSVKEPNTPYRKIVIDHDFRLWE